MRLLTSNYDSPAYRGYVLAVLFLTYASNFIDRYVLIVLQEPIRAEFGLSDTQPGLMTGLAFAVFYGTMVVSLQELLLLGGRLNDARRLRRVAFPGAAG